MLLATPSLAVCSMSKCNSDCLSTETNPLELVVYIASVKPVASFISKEISPASSTAKVGISFSVRPPNSFSAFNFCV